MTGLLPLFACFQPECRDDQGSVVVGELDPTAMFNGGKFEEGQLSGIEKVALGRPLRLMLDGCQIRDGARVYGHYGTEVGLSVGVLFVGIEQYGPFRGGEVFDRANT